jgi:uncharacterized protein
MDPSAAAPAYGPLDLLVIQPTPFCNLDCSYCYLPDRLNKKRISLTVLERIFQRVFESPVVTGAFTVVWHAGEPMVLPPAFYRDAFAVIARLNRTGVPVAHSLQTNGTLLDPEWCAFIKEHQVRVGISVDGPAFLNDRYRQTRSGAGTYDRTMAGIDLLHRHQVPFHVISVLTREALDYPDELYAFYVEHGIDNVGFNIEEIEGPNEHSSLSVEDADTRYRRFMSRFFDLVTRGDTRLQVREFEATMGSIMCGGPDVVPRTQENTPLVIISVDCDGNFSSFSPELLGLRSREYDDFVLGNVETTSLTDAVRATRFHRLTGDIAAGVARCRATCAYFGFCGGGAPVNKYYENGAFDSAETLFCRLNRKALVDVILEKLEGETVPPGSATARPPAHTTAPRRAT